ncbi:MAG: Uma2 family endonuclease [Thermoguttaceae bacterium]|jgi:Uma2 family endonuclease
MTPVTAEQLLHMPSDGYRHELVAGELRMMSPGGWQHGEVGGWLHGRMAAHIQTRRLGKLFMAETGFILGRDPDTVRAPDIAFIHKDHLPPNLPEDAFWPGAPDLAVEVVSPNETYREVDEKAKVWLSAGAQVVWVVNPLLRTVSVYRSNGSIVTLTAKDELTGEDVLPGFRCGVEEIFAGQ